jgi:hypothetical protein
MRVRVRGAAARLAPLMAVVTVVVIEGGKRWLG